jgi:hypothetical protein
MVRRLLSLQSGAGNRAVSRLLATPGPQRGPSVQRDADQEGGACCTSCASGGPCAGELDGERDGAEPDQAVQRAPGEMSVAPAPALVSGGTLDQRTGAFKSLVKTTAIHRLMGNQTNLAQWVTLLNTVVSASDLATVGMAQGGGSRPFFEMQVIEDPMVREIRANQVVGRFRACTGCHLENQVWGTRQERARLGGQDWQSPNTQRGLPGGYQPMAGSAEARVNEMFPSPAMTQTDLKRLSSMLDALGPKGYQVLPGDIMGDAEAGNLEAVRAKIGSHIAERSSDYGDLIKKIRGGDVGYEHFAPIIRDLLQVADPEVRAAIVREMDDHAFWSKVEAVVVGVLTVAVLLLTIFPPTSALGAGALGAMEAGLGAYGAVQAPDMIATGQAYSLGTGANDVFTREQQESGSGMVLGGFLAIVTAPLAVGGGAMRAASGGASLSRAGVLALRTGESMQSGRFLVTMADDGSLVAAVVDQPEVLIVVRDGTATAYQVSETGGLRVLGSSPVTLPGGASSGAGAAGGAAGRFPHVPQLETNWCGAACGEMAAERLGVEVDQAELAAHPGFQDPIIIGDNKVFSPGGFQTSELAEALQEIAPVKGRVWRGLSLDWDAVKTGKALRETMTKYLGSTKSSVILRVGRGEHWIVVDEVLPNGKIAIRDPGMKMSEVLTADALAGQVPTGDLVISTVTKK